MTTPTAKQEAPEIPLARAEELADELVGMFKPFCEVIRVAGSVRRHKPFVHDIEIVAVPLPRLDMFQEHHYDVVPLDGYLDTLKLRFSKNGNKYKQFQFEGAKVDLFLVTPPAQFGAIFTIRTGPADFSRSLVTAIKDGGIMPSHLKQRMGALWMGETLIPTPTEESYFDELGVKWIAPEKRK